MGVQKSNLNLDKIKNILEKEYDVKSFDVSTINRGTSNLFEIETENKKYILKEFISQRNKQTIMKEIGIINFLRERNINVPKYVKTVNGKYYTQNEGRIIIVQEFVEGYTIENNSGDYNRVIECASILGKLVKELLYYQDLSDENILEKYFSKTRVESGIEQMKQLIKAIKQNNSYKEQIKDELSYRIKILEEINDNFDFENLKKLTMLNSHGDFCSQQLIYNDKKDPTIIDFEKAKKLPIVWEVIRSYSYIDKDSKHGNINVDTLVDYFKEFEKYIKLNGYDLKYAPYLYLMQLASSTYGYKEYIEDCSQKDLLDFAFFRTKLCRDLYENKELISSKLNNYRC